MASCDSIIGLDFFTVTRLTGGRDLAIMDESFIEEWLESPQTSLYYSLQVMGDVQDKSDAYAALDEAE